MKGRDKENSRSQLNVYLAWSIINGIIRRNIYPRECAFEGLGGQETRMRGKVRKRSKNTETRSTIARIASLVRILLEVDVPLL